MKLRTNLLPRITALLLVLSMAFAMNCAAASVEAEELPDASVLAEQSAVYVEEDGSDEGDAVGEDWEDDEEDASKDSEVSSQEEDTGPYTLPVRSGDDITYELMDAVRDHSQVIIPAGTYTAGAINLRGLDKVSIDGSGATIQSDSSAQGIAVRGCTDISISNLTLVGAGTHGFYVVNSTGTFTNITVKDSQYCGFDATSTDTNVTVENCQFLHNGLRPRDSVENDDSVAAGLSVYHGAIVTAIDCTFSKNVGSGVVLSTTNKDEPASTVNLYGAVLTDNGDHGVGANPRSVVNMAASSTRRCLVKGNHTHGVMLMRESSSDFIKETDFENNGGMGLDVGIDSKAKLVENCTMTGNTSHGILVSRNASIKSVKKCTVTGNSEYGVRVDGGNGTASAKLTSVTVKKNKRDGIRITGSKASASISKSTFSNNKGSGIVVQDKAKLSSLINTKVTKNSKYGIRVYSKCTVGSTSGSSFSGNKGKQIYVDKGASTKLKTKK